jgi:hypothetical protein
VIRTLAAFLVLALSFMSAPAADVSNAKVDARADAKPDVMRFEWRSEGPARQCGDRCRTWISAVGAITEDTPADFEAFVANRDVSGSLIVIDSEGGSVLGAMALGRTFRRLDLTTSVGRTTTDKNGSVIVPDAYCQSMCAFLMLGGTRRFVPPEARVMVHQIWLAKKAKRSLEVSYSAEELGRVQRDVGSLARYTVEMGGGIELLETALRVPPWEPMYRLSMDEVRRMKLTTIDRPFADEVPTASVSKPSAILTAVHAQTGE